MGGLRGQEILIIVILLILVFGWKRLPDAARSLGRSARVFKSEVEEMKKDGKSDAADETVNGQSTDVRATPRVTPPPVAPDTQGTTYQGPAEAPQPVQPARPVQDGSGFDDPTRPVA